MNWRPEGETVQLGNRTIVYLPGLPWEEIDHAFIDDGAHLTIPRGVRLTEADLRRLDEQRTQEAAEDLPAAGQPAIVTPSFAATPSSGSAARLLLPSRWRYRCQALAALASEEPAAFAERLTTELNRLSDEGWELAALRDAPPTDRGAATLLILRQRQEE